MKKIPILFLILAFILSMNSCFDVPNTQNTTEMTTESSSSQQSPQPLQIPPEADHVYMTPEEYYAMLETENVPSDMITIDQLSRFGNDVFFQFVYNSYSQWYEYVFSDKETCHSMDTMRAPLLLKIYTQGSEYISSLSSKYGEFPILDIQNNDLTVLPDGVKSGYYETNDIVFIYTGGLLDKIIWESNGIAYQFIKGMNVSPEENCFERYANDSRYDSSIVKLFLNKETIPSAIAAFDEMLNTSQTPAT